MGFAIGLLLGAVAGYFIRMYQAKIEAEAKAIEDSLKNL